MKTKTIEEAESLLAKSLAKAVNVGIEHAAQYLEQVAEADEERTPELAQELRRHAKNIRGMMAKP